MVALALKRHANADGWSWPSPRRISALTGLGRSTVYQALKSLRACGALEKRTGGGPPRYRVAQQQGLLFSSANSLWESSGNHEENLFTAVESCPPHGIQSPLPGLEVRNYIEDRKPTPTRAHPARGSRPLWRQDAKRKRLMREIEGIREAYAGTPEYDAEALTRRDYRLRALYAELERIGCQVEKVG